MSAPPQRSSGVHLVGSIPLSCGEAAFRQACEALPGRLRRVPDGETGDRMQWFLFQRAIFAHAPVVLRNFDGRRPKTVVSVEDERLVKAMPPLQTGYDAHALASYATFRRLRAEGVIPPGVRFQVSLPTPLAVMGGLIEPAFRPILEPLYEEALLRALERIQTEIPRQGLAIQWDVAVQIGLLEKAGIFLGPWFEPVKEGIFERIVRLAHAVDEGVEMGFIFAMEPEDTSLLVEVAAVILERVERPVNWIHLPVPRNRDDAAYFAPLNGLKSVLGRTELYLGVVHADDEEGTQRKIRTASTVVEKFGVATECGMGRTSPADLASILHISAAVSSPIR